MFYDWTFIVLIPAMILAVYAQTRVNSAFRRYQEEDVESGLTGAEVARRILDMNGMQDVPVLAAPGSYSDHYDPTKRTVSLSQDVYYNKTLTATAVAAHECGHAIQHQQGYSLLNIRSAIAGPVSLISNASWLLLIAGLILIQAGSYSTGNLVFNIGVVAFAGVVVFHLVTLPVELNASSRALNQLEMNGMIDAGERAGVKKVLSAAALTYVAALAVAVAQLVRLLLIRGRR